MHSGIALALAEDNIDTDQLIPARFMSVPRSAGYAPYLMHDLRFDSDGAEMPDMPLNRFPDATVLITRRNFGSGSSREAAVYALVDFGIQAVIAPSFGDIFAGNAINNGLLPAVLPEEVVETLITQLGATTQSARIDLRNQRLQIGPTACDFELGPIPLQKLINGWDDIDMTASYKNQIDAFSRHRKRDHHWMWPTQG